MGEVIVIHKKMRRGLPRPGQQVRLLMRDGSERVAHATLVSYADGTGRPEELVIYDDKTRRAVNKEEIVGWFPA